ncbi:adenylate/guanylate cyclase domain-containing protein [Azospirillum sp. SYSU D00513]|uniref:adenylate/guanylate cyclase domain-containing protein n=1 Tax=Azospirillum sp. SYSU D00513 TaxID=2812561 RepID=UPI001A95CC2A|nr:adenylate/guanylate cyclase domain-containing protein [Azospirillum sp. SYSU D00513]
MTPRARRLLLVGLAGAVLCALLAWTARGELQGPSIDTLYWLRDASYGPAPGPQPSPVVVVGIDEETYRRPPFAGTPQAMWTPRLGTVLNALFDGGAKVVGMDVIHPTSVETLVPGFERDYLLALRRGGKAGSLVLAKVQHQTEPLVPYRGHALAAGGAANIRSVNLVEDPDGVLRRVPLTLTAAGPDGAPWQEPGLAVEIAARALGAPLERGPGGASLAGYAIPGSASNRMLINHPTVAGAIPTYSLADLHACAEAGDSAYFERHFRGKAVLVGTVLDVEDRKLSSNRWVTKPEGTNQPERCRLPVMAGLHEDHRRDSVPGVYLHAAAVSNLMAGNALDEAGPALAAALLLGLALAAAALTLSLKPLAAAGGLALVLAAWSLASLMSFRSGIVLPYLPGGVAAVLPLPLLLAVRFTVLDRDQRHIRNAFRLYLPARLIDEMLASGRTPSLGGEKRELSILFSDIAGFTALSEALPPEQLVLILNRYFTTMTDIVEAHGGFVDKYIGDAVLAVFGAPYCPANHARAAVDAALAMRAALEADPTLLAYGDGERATCRIGVASGPALIGNIGSPRRLNYTVMGDTVNLASRLEGVNKVYGTAVLVSEGTVARHGDAAAFRELDTVQVAGRGEPVTLHEPLAVERRADPAEGARRMAYAEALAVWRAGRFGEAAAAFEPLALLDPAAAVMRRKAAARLGEPAAGWTGVTALNEK